MKALSLALLTAALLTSGAALAETHTISVGYAQSKLDNFKDLRGVNVQYRYEWDSPFSVVGSFSYMTAEDNYRDYFSAHDSLKIDTDIKYYSLLAGPAYRINDYVSLYALGGLAYIKADEDARWSDINGTHTRASESYTSTSFAWGAGVQFNPTDDLSINVGYEGTTADFHDSYSLNGFNIGVSYRF